jgi:hypothetical protein
MKYSNITTRTAVFGLSLFISVGAYAAGSSPKGKPFIAIGDQIVVVEGAISSMQDQIDTLVGRVDSVEARVTANEGAITTLEDQNTALLALVNTNAADITSIEGQIAQLEADNVALSEDVSDNTDAIADNAAMIVTLQSALLMVQGGMVDLEDNLQEQIDHNNDLIVAIQDEVDTLNAQMALKQNLVNGTCPSGQPILEILDNGSVICDGAGSGTSGQLHSVYSWIYESANPGASVHIYAYCPSGYIVTGSGFQNAYNFHVTSNRTAWDSDRSNYGYVVAKNNNLYWAGMYGMATCTQIVP